MTDDITPLPCPFCGCAMSLSAVARDWWRVTGDHSDDCILLGQRADAPQTDDQKQLLIGAWNRRAAVEADRQGRMPSDEHLIETGCYQTVIERHSQPAASAEPNTHTDDDAVDRFAAAMKDKLAQARAKGRHGWQECDPSDLSQMLRAHVEKGDPRDVANFCCFLWSLGKPISAAPVAQEPVAYLDLGAGGYMDVGTDLTDEQLAALPKGRHMLAIIGTYGVDGYVAAPVAQEPVAEICGRRGERSLYWCISNPFRYPDGTKLYAAPVAAQAQPCDHVYEARPIDGSRSAVALVEAVCRKCGARGGVSLTPDMQRESQRGAESGRDHDTALSDTQRQIIEAAERRGYARAEAENVGYRTDAGRYRFIRPGDKDVWCSSGDDLLTGDRLDAAIDAARVAKGADHG
ncbi:hypothetical protein ACWKWV_09970 [Castellaniella ginsengisoli]